MRHIRFDEEGDFARSIASGKMISFLSKRIPCEQSFSPSPYESLHMALRIPGTFSKIPEYENFISSSSNGVAALLERFRQKTIAFLLVGERKLYRFRAIQKGFHLRYTAERQVPHIDLHTHPVCAPAFSLPNELLCWGSFCIGTGFHLGTILYWRRL